MCRGGVEWFSWGRGPFASLIRHGRNFEKDEEAVREYSSISTTHQDYLWRIVQETP